MSAGTRCYLRRQCSYQGVPVDIAVDVTIEQSIISTRVIFNVHSTTDRMRDGQATETFARGPLVIPTATGSFVCTIPMAVGKLHGVDILLGRDWTRLCGLTSIGPSLLDPDPQYGFTGNVLWYPGHAVEG